MNRKLVLSLIALGVVTAFASTTNADETTQAFDDMALVPAGEFIMGSDAVDTDKKGAEFGNVKPWYLDEHPRHNSTLPAYYIDRHEVSLAQYRDFMITSGVNPPDNWAANGYVLSMKKDALKQLPVEKLRALSVKVFRLDLDTRTMEKDEILAAIDQRFADLDKLPVTFVSWQNADNYCRWAGKRLPTEKEWEKAARGTSGREFPWGDTWKAGLSATGAEQWEFGVAPVGSYETDKSEFGIYDMVGNVSEWTSDWYQAYPGSDYKSEDFGEKFKVVRGAAIGASGHYALQMFQRSAYRGRFPADETYLDIGMRCAVDAPAAPAK